MARTLVLALGLCVLALPGLAAAKPKVAIVAFDNDKKGEAREMVADALADDALVLTAKQVNRAIADLAYDVAAGLEDKQVKRLEKELEADAIILGAVGVHGKDKVVHFKLFVHGKRVKGFKVEVGSFKSTKVRAKLHDKLLEKLGFGDDAGGAGGAGAGDDTSGDDAAPPANATKKLPPSDDGGDARSSADASIDPGEPHHPHGQVGEDGSVSVTARVEAPAAGARAHTPNRDAVRVEVGPSASQRNLSFTSRDFPQAPKGYSNTIVPGIRTSGEIYPYAFADPDSVASGFGIGGMFDQTLLLNLQTTIQPGTKFPVTQRRWDIGPRFRYVFGRKDTSISLVVAVDYGHQTFKVNRSALMPGNTLDIPDVLYEGFEPNVELRIPFTPRIALGVGGGVILLSSAGSIETQAQYGQASVIGGEGNLKLDVMITQRIGASLAFDFAQMGFTFNGTGAMSNDRDGDPSTVDVGGAADRYIYGAATLVVVY